jgi:DNA-binding GntR family transcriptional regulator
MKPTDSQLAYNQLKEKVVTVTLPPGSVIDEISLMAELGLGRTPIREAIKRLQSENLVVVTPRRGMYVADIAITDLVQIHEVRIEVEANCARLAAKRFTSQQLQRLSELIHEEKKDDQYDIHELIRLDRQFHALIAHAASNKYLYKDWETYYNLSLRIWYLVLSYLEPTDLGISDHVGILKAFEAGDEKSAEWHMRHHITNFYDAVKRSI